LERQTIQIAFVLGGLLIPKQSTAQQEPHRGVLLAGAGFVPRPEAGWGAVATIEVEVPLRSYPIGLWFGAVSGYQDGASVTVDHPGFAAIAGFYAGAAARTDGAVYFHGGVGLLLAGVWSNAYDESPPGVTITEELSSGAGIGGIGVVGIGFDIGSFVLRIDGMALGAAAGEGNSFAGYGGRLMFGARLL